MIKICDRTLSCIDEFTPTREQLLSLITFLFECDADYLELSEKMFRILGELPPFGSYILRINKQEKADEYPMFDCFICPRRSDEKRHVYAEIVLNDMKDSSFIMQHSHDRMIRISGMDTLFRDSVESDLQYIKKILPGKTEFCPGNSFDCAVAVGMEWINSGCGDIIVTSFGGIGGFAPFEEVLISLRHLFRRHPQTNYECLPRIRTLFEEITGLNYGICKPVIGKEIFTVESGIHVSGILRHPKCYEPFPPETVGGRRRFTYGKFSGRDGVAFKLKEWGVEATEEDILSLTQRVKALSEKLNRSISDEEMKGLL